MWKRTRQSHQGKQNPQERQKKQADLEMLGIAAPVGGIDLLYGDESGGCLWGEVGYSLYFRGEQKRQEQTKKGKRLSIIGLWQPLIQLVYSLALGSFKSKDFIYLMDNQVDTAQKAGYCAGQWLNPCEQNGARKNG